MSGNIRVAVANRPRLMRDLILATMADQPDIEIVAEIENESEIPRIVEQTLPEFLVLAADSRSERPALCDSLLRIHPEMKILALGTDGNWSVFYQASLDIQATAVEASESGILDALRSIARAMKGKEL
jgi:DNA-binding NarL/FixJ family response regulator